MLSSLGVVARRSTATLVIMVTTSACGLSSPPPATLSVPDVNPNAVIAAGVPTLAELYKGSFGSPPDSSPGPAAGNSVWFITCDSAVPACLLPGLAAEEAGDKLGIDVVIADGKLNIGGAQATAVRNAIAADADGIILMGMNCSTVQQPLIEAQQAGIRVLGAASTDCSDAGGPQLFSAPMIYSDTIANGSEWFYQMGANSADYIIDRTGGKARIIYSYNDTESQFIAADRGFRDQWNKCADCVMVDEIKHQLSDHVPNGPWIQNLRTALVRHPDVNGVYLEWDVFQTNLGGVQAVEEAGLNGAIKFGGEGVAETFDLVREGRVTALTKASSREWLGYAAMDNMTRALHGQPAAPQGLGFVVTDKDHNLPPRGEIFVAPDGVDFKGQYDRIWAQADR